MNFLFQSSVKLQRRASQKCIGQDTRPFRKPTIPNGPCPTVQSVSASFGVCHMSFNTRRYKVLITSCSFISLFFAISGFQRHGGPASRWQFPHRAFGLDALDLGDMWGWPFDIDFIIISIYSLHWVMAFIIFCGLCYFLLL